MATPGNFRADPLDYPQLSHPNALESGALSAHKSYF
jgi:hypothetical protein